MMGALNIASIGLAIGAMGQSAFFLRLFPKLSAWVVIGTLFIPWLTVHTISFCNRPPCGPRLFRHCLLFAMCWYAMMLVLAEALFFFIQPPPHGHFSLIIGRVLMYFFGAASFFILIRAYLVLRRYENKPDA